MKTTRRQFSPQEKVRILRQHYVDKVPVSDVCDRHGLNPTVFYRWQKQFFENGAAAFERAGDRGGKKQQAKMEALQARLAQKDEVIAEIMASHVQLKKSLGEI
ncbi:MAG: transposase [Planctomycetota bacterium]|jgi:transposase-like protein